MNNIYTLHKPCLIQCKTEIRDNINIGRKQKILRKEEREGNKAKVRDGKEDEGIEERIKRRRTRGRR